MPKLSSQLASISVFAAAAALTGCGGGSNYPSLAQRPAELGYTLGNTGPKPVPDAPAGPAIPEPAIVHQVDALRTDAARSSEAFAQRANDAEHLAHAAHGAAVGSEARSASTVAMAALDSARSDTAQSLAALDALQARTALFAADSSNPRDKATFQVVATADAAVGAMMDAQNARISALHAMTGD